MQLVHENKDEPGKWQVAWTWLPHFIATNPDVVADVSSSLTEMFKGKVVTDDLIDEMHTTVISLILLKFPWPGLKEYLAMVTSVHPEEKLPE